VENGTYYKMESGISMTKVEIPDLLPYPSILNFDECPELNNKMCFVINRYPLSGVMMMVVRHKMAKDNLVTINLADFSGNKEVVSEEQAKQVMQYSQKIILTMKLTGIPKAIFYFSMTDKPILVDIRLSQNKFISPGYIIDFYGKQGIPIQESINKPIAMSDDNIKMIKNAVGDYSFGKFILKSSVPNIITKNEQVLPTYALIG
jgi:hypothetical protein